MPPLLVILTEKPNDFWLHGLHNWVETRLGISVEFITDLVDLPTNTQYLIVYGNGRTFTEGLEKMSTCLPAIYLSTGGTRQLKNVKMVDFGLPWDQLMTMLLSPSPT